MLITGSRGQRPRLSFGPAMRVHRAGTVPVVAAVLRPPGCNPFRRSRMPKAPIVIAPAPAPRLTPLLTPEQQRHHNQQIDESLDRVRRNLRILGRRSLTTEQSEALERIHAFLQQTAETRKVDLATATILARRADLLTQGLERTTR